MTCMRTLYIFKFAFFFVLKGKIFISTKQIKYFPFLLLKVKTTFNPVYSSQVDSFYLIMLCVLVAVKLYLIATNCVNIVEKNEHRNMQ